MATDYKTDYNIRKVWAREILDSRGNPTIEVDISTNTDSARAAVPSGASTGIHEALELRDGGMRYHGKGVRKAVQNVCTKISRVVTGMDCRRFQAIDKAVLKLDGTSNKSALGANAILGVSLAAARLAANTQKKPLYTLLGGKNVMPVPCMNVINGGRHADNKLQFQEFMICPHGKTFADSLRMGSETYQVLKQEIAKAYGKSSTNVGDEGGFAPNLKGVEDALYILDRAIKKAGYDGLIKIAIDAASSEFYDKKKQTYLVDGKWMSADRLTKLYEHIMDAYPVFSIEDPFDQDDFAPYPALTASARKRKVQIVGDDLLVTSPERIRIAIAKNMCNALLLKVNQIGSLSEAMAAAKLSMDNGWNVMVSHRSGETEDPFIADLAVGLGTGQIKTGAPCRSERLAKYNQLLRIEEELGLKARMGRI
ncbi:phosphopyruvate hydratase [Candidatus Woesearchaeota archaeon]|nr:phosphopyruvate hydratase [Candidatus Woesearchaeota archaeon]